MATSPGQYKGTDITPGTQEQIMAQMAAIDKAGTQPIAPISASSLAQTATPFNVPPPTTSTAAASFQGQMEEFTASLDTAAKNAKAAKDQSGSAFANALFGAQGETAITDELYSKPGGVDETEAELKDINSQILQEQEGLRREIETIQENAEGLTRGAVAGRIDEARRKSLRTQADLAVVQMAKQGKFDSAKAIADRAVAVQMEKQKQTLETLRFIYEENKGDYEKADQRAFETKFKERERQLQNEEYRLRAQFDQKIRQEDPLYQAQLQHQRMQTRQIQAALNTSYNLEISQEDFDRLPSADKNNMTLLQLMSHPKILAGNKASIGAALSIARAAQELAGDNPNGQFAGIYPFRGLFERFYPGSSPFKRNITVQNTAQIDAIHLNTQYWASGAALTEEQTQKVNSMIPTISDSDQIVRTKLNSLVNYMMTHTSSKLLTDGINFTPAKVNLFETADLLEQASEEQKAELRAQGALQ